MSSVLSPGWSHQWLPYSTTAKSVGSRPGRCSRQAYGYADCLDRYCLGRIRINSHNTINPVNFQEIRTSSVHTGHIWNSVSIFIKVVKYTIYSQTGIFCKSISIWINVFHQILCITYNYPSCSIFSGSIQISVNTVLLHELISLYFIILQIIPGSIILFPSVCIQTAGGRCNIPVILVTHHGIFVHSSLVDLCIGNLKQIHFSIHFCKTAGQFSAWGKI